MLRKVFGSFGLHFKIDSVVWYTFEIIRMQMVLETLVSQNKFIEKENCKFRISKSVGLDSILPRMKWCKIQ